MARSQGDAPGADPRVSAEGWGSAIARSVLMLLVVFIAFAVVPNWLADRLATRVTPTGRDLIVIAWWLAALIGCTWLFMRLQATER